MSRAWGLGFTHISAGGEDADAWSPPGRMGKCRRHISTLNFRLDRGEELVACEEAPIP